MFVVRVGVEHGKDDVYCVGPFTTKEAAELYCKAYHGTLDTTDILPLSTQGLAK